MARSHEEISHAINVAMEVFRRDGYERTGIEDLVEATGLNRYAIYQHFGGKRELFLAALNRDHENMMEDLKARLETQSDSTMRVVREFMQGPLSEMVGSTQSGFAGPLTCQAAFELAPHDDQIACYVDQFMKKKLEEMTKIFQRAADDGSLREGIQPSDAARLLHTVMFGLTAISQCPQGADVLVASMDATFAILSSSTA